MMRKILFAIPIMLMLMGASCQTKPDMNNYPPNTLVECPQLKETVLAANAQGISLGEFYLDDGKLVKQYADCATIHNELIRFIKQQQK